MQTRERFHILTFLGSVPTERPKPIYWSFYKQYDITDTSTFDRSVHTWWFLITRPFQLFFILQNSFRCIKVPSKVTRHKFLLGGLRTGAWGKGRTSYRKSTIASPKRSIQERLGMCSKEEMAVEGRITSVLNNMSLYGRP